MSETTPRLGRDEAEALAEKIFAMERDLREQRAELFTQLAEYARIGGMPSAEMDECLSNYMDAMRDSVDELEREREKDWGE